ncbi:hypothetical protein DKG71_14635 [Streptomyces sp. NEAU-S7GS2]|nr:hypothetical protein DKG71_14635 [Streptomyces sp. NEAU-S7GS2]
MGRWNTGRWNTGRWNMGRWNTGQGRSPYRGSLRRDGAHSHRAQVLDA